jgi:hypothetical protein
MSSERDGMSGWRGKYKRKGGLTQRTGSTAAITTHSSAVSVVVVMLKVKAKII